jgi:hypothetical protein
MFCGSNNNDNSPVFIICILNRYHWLLQSIPKSMSKTESI